MLMELESQLQRLLSDLRKLEYLMSTDRFVQAMKIAKSDQLELIKQMTQASMSVDSKLREKAINDLREFCDHLTGRDITVTKLREQASRLCIKNYSRLNRDELVECINKRLVYDPRNISTYIGNQNTAYRDCELVSSGDSIHESKVPSPYRAAAERSLGMAEKISGRENSRTTESVVDAHAGDVAEVQKSRHSDSDGTSNSQESTSENENRVA